MIQMASNNGIMLKILLKNLREMVFNNRQAKVKDWSTSILSLLPDC